MKQATLCLLAILAMATAGFGQQHQKVETTQAAEQTIERDTVVTESVPLKDTLVGIPITVGEITFALDRENNVQIWENGVPATVPLITDDDGGYFTYTKDGVTTNFTITGDTTENLKIAVNTSWPDYFDDQTVVRQSERGGITTDADGGFSYFMIEVCICSANSGTGSCTDLECNLGTPCGRSDLGECLWQKATERAPASQPTRPWDWIDAFCNGDPACREMVIIGIES